MKTINLSERDWDTTRNALIIAQDKYVNHLRDVQKLGVVGTVAEYWSKCLEEVHLAMRAFGMDVLIVRVPA